LPFQQYWILLQLNGFFFAGFPLEAGRCIKLIYTAHACTLRLLLKKEYPAAHYCRLPPHFLSFLYLHILSLCISSSPSLAQINASTEAAATAAATAAAAAATTAAATAGTAAATAGTAAATVPVKTGPTVASAAPSATAAPTRAAAAASSDATIPTVPTATTNAAAPTKAVATTAAAAAAAVTGTSSGHHLPPAATRKLLVTAFPALTCTNVKDALVMFGGTRSLSTLSKTYLLPRSLPSETPIADTPMWVVFEDDTQLQATVAAASQNAEPWGFGHAFRILPVAAGTSALTPIQNTHKSSYRSWLLPATHETSTDGGLYENIQGEKGS
jgi:hypothetical protein